MAGVTVMGIAAAGRSAGDVRAAAWRRAWPPLALLGVCAVHLAIILVLNDGTFTYGLDDPYIHLAVAEEMAGLRYGINPGEYAAPSSSILWPVVLIPFAHTSLHEWVPLFWNALAAAGVVMLLQRAIERIVAPAWPAIGAWSGGLALALAFALNVPGLVFTGMEHTAQVLMALAVAYGLIRRAEGGRTPWWLLAAVILGPLIRYENAALSLGALAWLALRGNARAALVAGAALVALLGAFSLFLRGLDLPWLPTSILVKKGLAPGADLGWVAVVVQWLLTSAPHSYTGWVLLALAVAALYGVARRRAGRDERAFAALALVVVLAQLTNGTSWSYPRYEIYALGGGGLLLLYAIRDALVHFVRRGSRLRGGLAAGGVFVGLFPATVAASFGAPLASHNIYLQQYQMHRAALALTDAPVAVNDLGWVAYRNEHYVLDLWGLGSAEAARHRRLRTPGWMARLAEAHGVELVMIYDRWFAGQVPLTWIPLGRLVMDRLCITPAERTVAFYATSEASAQRLAPRLAAFAATLPRGARFEPETATE